MDGVLNKMEMGLFVNLNAEENTWNSNAASTPVATFTGTPLTGTAPLSVVFTETSSNIPNFWLWEKNDGGGWVNFSGHPTDGINVTESFAAGTWSVRMTASNTAGANTQTRTNYVTAT